MRQRCLFLGLLMVLAWSALPTLSSAEDKKENHKEGEAAGEHGPKFQKYKAQIKHEKKEYDLTKKEEREALLRAFELGEIEEMEGVAPDQNPMTMDVFLSICSILIFVLLLFILRKMAWTPMLQGLQKREESIRNSVEEAKKAREETARISAEFKVKMDEAYAEIPKIMENARREAEAFKEEMRSQTTKDIQAERQRLRREIETARDQALQELWNQAAQLATLISAKAIGRSLTEDDHRRLLDEAIAEIGQSASHRPA
jgi:F-type H+-transporting ATPase subunit b